MSFSFRVILSLLTWLAGLLLEGAKILSYFPLDEKTMQQLHDFLELSFILIFPPIIELAILLMVAVLLLILPIIPAGIVWKLTLRFAHDAERAEGAARGNKRISEEVAS